MRVSSPLSSPHGFLAEHPKGLNSSEHKPDSCQSIALSSSCLCNDPDTEFIHTIAFLEYQKVGLNYAFDPDSDRGRAQIDLRTNSTTTGTQPTHVDETSKERDKDAFDFTTSGNIVTNKVAGSQNQSQVNVQGVEQIRPSMRLFGAGNGEPMPARPKKNLRQQKKRNIPGESSSGRGS